MNTRNENHSLLSYVNMLNQRNEEYENQKSWPFYDIKILCALFLTKSNVVYLWTKVVFPDPAMPSIMMQQGCPDPLFVSPILMEERGIWSAILVSPTWGSLVVSLEGFSAILNFSAILFETFDFNKLPSN